MPDLNGQTLVIQGDNDLMIPTSSATSWPA
jgi:hypothetical protein